MYPFLCSRSCFFLHMECYQWMGVLKTVFDIQYNLFDPNTLDTNPPWDQDQHFQSQVEFAAQQNGGGETCDHTATGCSKTWLDHETAAF